MSGSAARPPDTASSPGLFSRCGRARSVLIASDKFKGSLSAAEVARHLSRGLLRVIPELEIRVAPVADGGEGTLLAALHNGFRPRAVTVTGPTGASVQAAIGIRDDTAIVELAQASGLRLCPPGLRQPMLATSYGTGELVRTALDAGCRTVVLAVGGSACTDGGLGMIQALGAAVTDTHGQPVGLGGAALADVNTIDLVGLDPRLAQTTLLIGSDVDNPLLGPTGAAQIFGPQKGATPQQVALLETSLRRWADIVRSVLGRDCSLSAGAGAAGGVGFAALAFLQARHRSGIDIVLDMINFDELLAGAGLVITGEGSLDEQTLGGKAPLGVARRASAMGVPTIAVAGRSNLSAAQLSAAGFLAVHTLDQLESDLARCVAEPGPLLERIGEHIATRPWPGRTRIVGP